MLLIDLYGYVPLSFVEQSKFHPVKGDKALHKSLDGYMLKVSIPVASQPTSILPNLDILGLF